MIPSNAYLVSHRSGCVMSFGSRWEQTFRVFGVILGGRSDSNNPRAADDGQSSAPHDRDEALPTRTTALAIRPEAPPSEHPRVGNIGHGMKRCPGATTTPESNLCHQLFLRYRRLAGVACFPGPQTTRDLRDPIVRQTTIVDFVPYQQPESVAIFGG